MRDGPKKKSSTNFNTIDNEGASKRDYVAMFSAEYDS
jgi:hypothetical protein